MQQQPAGNECMLAGATVGKVGSQRQCGKLSFYDLGGSREQKAIEWGDLW